MTCPCSLELVSSGGKGTRAGSQVSTVEEMIPHQEVLGQRSAGAEEGPLEGGHALLPGTCENVTLSGRGTCGHE